MGVWIRVSLGESSYHAWVVNVLETIATSWEIYNHANIINSPQAIFFSLSTFFCLYLTHPHAESVVPVQKDLTPQPYSICSGNVGRLLCILSTSNYTESAFSQYEGQGPFCVHIDYAAGVLTLWRGNRQSYSDEEDRCVNLKVQEYNFKDEKTGHQYWTAHS